jgi:hypothetical protein
MKKLLFIITLCMLASIARADDATQTDGIAQADDAVQAVDVAQADDNPQANAVEYSYVRLGYTYETLPNELWDETIFSGTALDLSWAYNDRLALIVNYYSADPDRPMYVFSSQAGFFLPMREVPQEYTGIGALYHRSLGADTDLQLSLEMGNLSFWHETVFGLGSRASGNSGTRVSAGLSSRFFDRLEAKLLLRKFQYMDSEGSGLDGLDDVVVEANYFFTGQYSAGLSFISTDLTDRFVMNVGYSF